MHPARPIIDDITVLMIRLTLSFLIFKSKTASKTIRITPIIPKISNCFIYSILSTLKTVHKTWINTPIPIKSITEGKLVLLDIELNI